MACTMLSCFEFAMLPPLKKCIVSFAGDHATFGRGVPAAVRWCCLGAHWRGVFPIASCSKHEGSSDQPFVGGQGGSLLDVRSSWVLPVAQRHR